MMAEAERNTPVAVQIITELLTTRGPDTAGTLVTIMIDTYLDRINGSSAHLTRRAGGVECNVAPMFVTGTETRSVEETHPDVVWAGRMITARAAWDEDTWNALFNAAAVQGRLGRGIFALLHVIGSGLRDHDAGRQLITINQGPMMETPDSPEGLI